MFLVLFQLSPPCLTCLGKNYGCRILWEQNHSLRGPEATLRNTGDAAPQGGAHNWHFPPAPAISFEARSEGRSARKSIMKITLSPLAAGSPQKRSH